MAQHSFVNFINVESSTRSAPNGEPSHAVPTVPEKAVARTYHSVPLTPDAIELETLPREPKSYGPPESGAATPPGCQTLWTPNDLEMSRAPSPTHGTGVDAMQSVWDPYMNRFRMLSVCMLTFGNGLSDSAPGALIPYIEK